MVKIQSASLLKRSTLYICAVTVTVSSFFAVQNGIAGEGDRHGKRVSVEQRVEHLNKKLNLTEQQKQQITVIFTEFDKRTTPDRDATKEQRREQMQEWRAQREKINDQIVAVLTPEQKVQYEKMQAEQKEKMKERMEKRKEKKDSEG